MPHHFDYNQIVKATQSFSPSNLIGKGSHGSVYKAIFHPHNSILAIKKPSFAHVHVSFDNLNKLHNEIFVLSSLPQSPYIISFFGTSNEQEDEHKNKNKNKNKLLVMEFMPNGSLYHLLHVAKTPPSWSKRLEIALQIARAIDFLHQGKPLVIHRDIKSANVLFDSNWNAKLADYGLAVSQLSQLTSQPAGTIGYMDPCYTTPSKLSTKNDVFSYGVVLLEIICGKKAIDVSSNPASIVEWAIPLIKKQRLSEIYDGRIGPPPALMEGTVKHLLYMAARCVSLKEETRPSMGDIIGCNFLVERVKVGPSWVSLVRNLILMRGERKIVKKWHEGKCSSSGGRCSDISKGKLLLRELLADITLK